MRVLVMGGTGEARALASALAERKVDAVVSLAGATRQPEVLALPVRTGGFGGAGAQAAYMRGGGFSHVIDATHPFAARISARTASLCGDMGLPYLQLLRPGWEAGPGDDWRRVADEAAAVAAIPEGAAVFLATGRQTLAAFAGLAGRRVFCRVVDPPEAPFPFEGGEFVVGRPPFSVGDEVALFRRLGIGVLVVKDAGGEASRSKLDAARVLGLPVVMIRRPPQPEAERVATVAEALAWLDAQVPA